MGITQLLLAFTATALAFFLNLYITPALIHLSYKKKWFDNPEDERKIHSGQISRMGGVGIVISLILAILITAFGTARLLNSHVVFNLGTHHNPLLIIAGILVIFITGMLDDFANLSARFKLLGQIMAAILVMAGGGMIRYFTIPFTDVTLSLSWFGAILTLLWIVGMANAINLIDGMDGLSAGISAMACFAYGLVFLVSGQYMLSLFVFTLLGSLFGYLFYNFPPAKIFMGDSGSLTLGFLLSLLPLLAAPESGTSLVMPIVMLFIPIADVLAAMMRRKRKGQHFFIPDREHMHHKLLDFNLDARQILSIVLGMQIVSGFSVLLFIFVKGPIRFLPILFTLLLGTFFFLYLHWKRHRK